MPSRDGGDAKSFFDERVSRAINAIQEKTNAHIYSYATGD
jgi:hypothetical protein